MTRAQPLDIASATHPGRVRLGNEDSLAADAALGYAVLADGMGGRNAGEVASRIAVETLERGLRRWATHPPADEARLDQALVREVAAANAAILSAAAAPDRAGMGTTVVVAIWRDDIVAVAHVGDSRMYRLRGECLEQLTHDHSLAQEQVDCGLIGSAEARYSVARSYVTRALGVEPDVAVEVHLHSTRPGDLYLLCTDGLSDMMDEAAIAAALHGGQGDLAGTARALVQRANDNGGRDNVTVILARVRAQRTARPQSGR